MSMPAKLGAPVVARRRIEVAMPTGERIKLDMDKTKSLLEVQKMIAIKFKLQNRHQVRLLCGKSVVDTDTPPIQTVAELPSNQEFVAKVLSEPPNCESAYAHAYANERVAIDPDAPAVLVGLASLHALFVKSLPFAVVSV